MHLCNCLDLFFFFQAEDGIRDADVTGVQTCALPICFQWSDNLTWLAGRHTFKVGGDINLIQLRSKKLQIFELDFGGVVNFGGLTAANLGLPGTFVGVPVPGVTAVQAYGLGLPQTFIQGIGRSNRPFSNKAFAFFIQDSWKVHPRLTLNYGVRYDLELTPIFPAAT